MSASRLEQLLGFLENAPDDAFLLFAVAKEYEGMGDRDHALEYYLRLTRTQSGYVGAYYHLGKLYELLGDPATAFRTYTDGMAVARQAKDQHAYNELAAARLNLGDEDDFE